MAEESIVIMQDTADASLTGPAAEPVSKFDNRRKKPWEVFKKQACNDEQAEQVVQFDSFRDKCQVNTPHNTDEGHQPYKLNRSTYLQNIRNNTSFNSNTNNTSNNSNHSENSKGWKGKGEKDFKSLNKTEPKQRQPQGPNRFTGKNDKNGYKKGENENNNSVNISGSRGMTESSFLAGTSSQNNNTNGSSAWPSSKNFNQSTNTNAGSNRDDRKQKRFDKQQPKQSQQQQQQRDIDDSFSIGNEDSLSPSQRQEKQQSPQEKQLFKKRQKICGSWVRVADKQKLDRPPSYQDYLGKLTQGLDQRKTFSTRQQGEDEEDFSDQMIGDLEDGEIELQGDNNGLNRSAGSKVKSTILRSNLAQQQQQPRGFTGNNSKSGNISRQDDRDKDEQDEFNEEIDEGISKKKKIKQEDNGQDGQGKSNSIDITKLTEIPEPFQVLQKMDQLGNDIIKNKKGHQTSLQVQQTIAAQQDAFLQQYFSKQKKSDTNNNNFNGNNIKGQRNFKSNNPNEDVNMNRNNNNNYGNDNGFNNNSNGAGHRKEKRFDIENYRVDFEKNMIDHNVNITEGLKNLVKIQNQLYVQTHAKKEEMKEAAAVAKRTKQLTGLTKDDEDDDLNQFEKFNDEYLKKQEQMLEEIAKRNKEKVNQIKNSSGQKDLSRDYQGLSTHPNDNNKSKHGTDSPSEDAEENMNPLEKLIQEELERNRQDKQAQSYRLLELQKLHQSHNPIQIDPKIMQPYHHEPKQGSVTSQQLQIMAQAKCESGASRKRPSKFSDIPLPPVPVHDTMAQLERLRQMTQFSSQGPSAFASFPKLTPMQAYNGVPHIQGMNFQANSFVPQQIPLPQSLSGINSLAQLQKTLFTNNSKNFNQQIKQAPDNTRKVPSPKTIQEEEITPTTVVAPSSQGNSLEIPLPESRKSSVVSKLNKPSVTKVNIPTAAAVAQSTNNSAIPAPSSASASVAKSAPQVLLPKQEENPFSIYEGHENIEIPEAIKNKQKHMKPALYEKVLSDYIKMHKQAKEELAKKDEGALQKSKDPRRRAQIVQTLSAEQIALKAAEELSKSIMEIEADSQQLSEESLVPPSNYQIDHTSSVLGFSVANDETRQLGDNNIVYNYKILKGEKRMLSQEQNLLDKHQQLCLQEAELLHASKSADQNNDGIIREEDNEQNLNDLFKDDKEIRYFRENLAMCCMRCGQNGHYARWCPQQPEEITQCLFCLGNHSREYCNSFVCFKCYSVGHRIKDCAFDLSLDQARCRLCRKKGHTYRSCGVLQVELPSKGFDQISLQDTICLNCGEEGHVNCFDPTLYLSYDGLYKIDKETLDKIA